ncbi:hypothetical protein Tco_0296833 [Tanacetum coccineum]
MDGVKNKLVVRNELDMKSKGKDMFIKAKNEIKGNKGINIQALRCVSNVISFVNGILTMGKQDDVIIIFDDHGTRKKTANEVKRPNSLINRPKSDARITYCIVGLRAPKAIVGYSSRKMVK